MASLATMQFLHYMMRLEMRIKSVLCVASSICFPFLFTHPCILLIWVALLILTIVLDLLFYPLMGSHMDAHHSIHCWLCGLILLASFRFIDMV